MKKLFHFVPSLDIGGVEIAIKKSLPELKEKLDISIFYVKHRGILNVGQKPWWHAFGNFNAAKPDIVITSLWLTHPLGFLFKLFGVKWVCFIHNSRFKHFIDRFICTLAVWCSDKVAADSNQAAVFVSSIRKSLNVHVIPYVFSPPQVITKIPRIKNTFIFVGRNAREKRIDHIVDFFKYLLNGFPNVTCRFEIAGDVPKLILNLKEVFVNRVFVESNSSNDEVFQKLYASEYFVVLSDLEGFCMTAYEAVQAGCFVVYRDVGEIKNYVIPDNSFKVTNLENLYVQFGDILEKRKNDNFIEAQHSSVRQSTNSGETYTSRFLALIEACTQTEKQQINISAKQSNIEMDVIKAFGSEWSRFDQSDLLKAEQAEMFKSYFDIFPWDSLPAGSIGVDIGCGSGRWASLVAPRVGHLHLVDPSDAALAVARQNLLDAKNVSFHQVLVDGLPFERDSLDFAYSLGVLHHVVNTQDAIRSIANVLKPGAPFLIYLYYAFDQRPWWFRMVWRASDILRRFISRMPAFIKNLICEAIALFIYFPLARFALLLEKFNMLPDAWPLAYYRNRGYYVMRTDALDRFGTRLEKRFSRREIEDMLQNAGFTDIRFSEAQPFWCAVGTKKV